MNLPPRFVSIFGLLQGFFIVASYLFTRTCLNAHDRLPEMEEGGLYMIIPRIPMLVRFVGSYGLWFLLVPVGWGVIAVFRAEIFGANAWLRELEFPVGLTLTLATMMLFSYCAFHSLGILL